MSEEIGTLGTLAIRLANWLPRDQIYQRRYHELTPESESVSSDAAGLVVDTAFRPWVSRSWVRGEGFDVWERGQHGYRIGNGVRPHPTKSGLILAYEAAVTTWVPTADAGYVFGIAQGLLWQGDDATVFFWDNANERWATGWATGAGANNIFSIADGDDETNIYIGLDNSTIRQVSSAANSSQYATGTADDFVQIPVLCAFDGRLFALDGTALYEIDKSVNDTRTLRAQPNTGSPASWALNEPAGITTSDVGPVWLQRLDNGQTVIWEYNVADDTQKRIGQLPIGFVQPNSIISAHGFVFVGFTNAPATSIAPTAGYIAFLRGAQRGVLGPLPVRSALAAGDSVQVFGVLGSEVVFKWNGYMWAYDVDEGGVFQYSGALPATTSHSAVYGPDVFVSRGPAVTSVYRIEPTVYTASGTVHLGWHDWDYPGLIKEFLDLTILTEPLPASTSVTAAVAVDGSTTYTALTGTHDVDGATAFTFTVANPTSAPIVGNRFEVRLTLATSNSANTPTIIEVSGRATGSQHILEVIMQIDAGSIGEQTSSVLIDGLNALASSNSPVTFTDVFQQRLEGAEAADSYVVRVADVITPQVENAATEDDHPVAQLKLRARSLV